MKHKYLFMEISNTHEVIAKRTFCTREKAVKAMSNILMYSNTMVKDILYRDARQHQHEYVCYDGTRFLINRI